jgi:hypothetical protein
MAVRRRPLESFEVIASDGRWIRRVARLWTALETSGEPLTAMIGGPIPEVSGRSMRRSRGGK